MYQNSTPSLIKDIRPGAVSSGIKELIRNYAINYELRIINLLTIY